MTDKENPLLSNTALPEFSKIKPTHIEPAIDGILADNRHQIAHLLEKKEKHTWENLMQPAEDLDDRLHRSWSVVSHLNSVMNSDAIRAPYNACLPKLSTYSTELGQNQFLYEAVKSVEENKTSELDAAQYKAITDELRDFRLVGVHLPPEQKKQLADLRQKLSKFTSKFEENVLDATQGWHKRVLNEDALAGLSDYAIASAKQAAQERNMEGWLFTLEFPSYYAVMTYANARQFRKEMYEAYVTRASDQGINAGKWDNTDVMHAILMHREALAKTLDFSNYAEYSLATKMAENTEQVLTFLNALANAAKPQAEAEFAELADFARTHNGIEQLQAWDIAYYSEKLRQFRFDVNQEVLRPYFPEDRVLSGLFTIVNRLFGIKIKELTGVDTWHNDVRFFEIHDAEDNLRGQFYLDAYARQNKRGGAWADQCRVRRKKLDGDIQTPVAYLVCNFNPPVGNQPSLLTHEDVLTLFHEFGHGLHHMLTKVDYAAVSGLNGVPWDAVEFPSQFMEHWCWEKEAIELISGHFETDEPLPEDLLIKLQNAKNFQSAMKTMRQLEFALFDFRLHTTFDPEKGEQQIQKILDDVREQVSVVPVPEYNRFQHAFSHIFGGGYAAGYYSYKWAELLACDAFGKFKEEGVFNPEVGKEFMQIILEKGGSVDPMTLFVEFRGRKPTIDALLEYSGIHTNGFNSVETV